MNEIERMFYDAFCEVDEEFNIKPQYPVGIYTVDFLVNGTVVVEIDGHERHKTKEQRYEDYRRERFLMKEGYIVVRFMGSEVFVNPKKCIEEVEEIDCLFQTKITDAHDEGIKWGMGLK